MEEVETKKNCVGVTNFFWRGLELIMWPQASLNIPCLEKVVIIDSHMKPWIMPSHFMLFNIICVWNNSEHNPLILKYIEYLIKLSIGRYFMY